MKPDEPSNSQSGTELSQQQSGFSMSKDRTYLKEQETAGQIIKEQINNIYKSSETTESQSPYFRDHKPDPAPQSADWKQYHTAWQEYYQKYYEGYYKHHLEQVKKQHAITTHTNEIPKEEKKSYFGSHHTNPATHEQDQLSTDEVILSLRRRLLGKVYEAASRVKNSRHFAPILSGVIAVLVLLFMQYNQILVANVMAYVSPGSINPQNIVVDPNTNVKVSPEPRLIIPKINVDVPVLYDVGNDHNSQMAAMKQGVAHFAIPGANSHPGEIGNTVIAGHSSNDLFDSGDYKFIFAQIDKLNTGDTIYANYKSTRYTYIVTQKQIVAPSDVKSLVYTTKKPILTLLTCTPLGTSINRLLVIAEQISPDPDKATSPKTNPNQTETSSIPGTNPTLLERLFGIGN